VLAILTTLSIKLANMPELRTDYPVIKHEVGLPRLGKEAIVKTMGYLALPREEYFVIGGANLVLRDIRDTTIDIDMLVSDGVFGWLAKRKGAEMHEPPKLAIARGADNQTVWVKNNRTPIPVSATTALGDGYYPMSFESHREHTETIEGVTCLTLEHVRASKEALQRTKDVEDLASIAHFLGEPLDLPEPTVKNPWLFS
jgi:hypothetical protein